MKWLSTGVLTALLSLAVGSAEASVIAGSDGPFQILDNSTASFGVNLYNGKAGDSFTADFLFQTGGAPDGGATAIECTTGCANLQFTSFDLYARSNANEPIGTPIASGNFDTLPGTTIDYSVLLAFGALEAGSYLVRTAGYFLGSGDASIGGNVSLTPIPGAAVLFGSALAGLGAVASRRRKTAEATVAAA
ncbi:hypothetical protein [Benzoatithermus flavus]|uniref:VPLPA-CTERM protein sorting domain-containing protein n=1 Tax=Benzoatithermus flavus TaxID=3108223 RepID=A0ABU8XR13_9PROT